MPSGAVVVPNEESGSKPQISRRVITILRTIGIVLASATGVIAIGGMAYAVHEFWNLEDQLFQITSSRPTKFAIGYRSQPQGARSPHEYGVDYDSIAFPNRYGHTLRGFFLKHAAPGEVPTIVYLAGHLSNAGMLQQYLAPLTAFSNVLVVDFSGRGWSDGPQPSEFSTYSDAADMLAFARSLRGIDQNRLFVMTTDVGAAVAAKIVAEAEVEGAGALAQVTEGIPSIPVPSAPLQGLIMFDPIPSMKDAVDRIDRHWLHRLFTPLSRRCMDAAEFIKGVQKTPMLIYSPSRMMPEHSRKVFDSCRSTRKTLVRMRGADMQFANLWVLPGAEDTIAHFIADPTAAFGDAGSRVIEVGGIRLSTDTTLQEEFAAAAEEKTARQ